MTLRAPLPFIQTHYWQAFQEALGHQTLFLEADGYSCLLVKRSTKLGTYLMAPYGPVADSSEKLAEVLSSIKRAAKESGAAWARVEPRCEHLDRAQTRRIIEAVGGQKSPRDVNPSTTRIIDLVPPEEEIYAQLSSTNRSLVRRNNENHEITFTTSTSPADIGLFNEMIKSVESRNKVHFYSPNYYSKQAEILMPAGAMYLELAFFQGKPVGSIIMHQLDGAASYTYAASLPEARDKNVSALLAWQAIKNAKARGARRFDFFGVAPKDASPNHPWQGFSAFKAKFGGEIVEFSGTWDLPISYRHKLYKLAKKLK